MNLLNRIRESRKLGRKELAVLIDPESTYVTQLSRLLRLAEDAQVDYFFVGGSTVDSHDMENCLAFLDEANEKIPVILFPGNTNQLSNKADGLLYLSLISGRNPDLLIGKHVESVPFLRNSSLEIMPTGYILIDGGTKSTVAYISNTTPIPSDSVELTLATGLAGQYLGMQLIYLEAGSGAIKPVSPKIISTLRQNLDVPLIVGGGIKTPKLAKNAAQAGADLIVIGNILEKDPDLLMDLSIAVHSSQSAVL